MSGRRPESPGEGAGLRSVAVLGIGNTLMGDDGAGVAAAFRLRSAGGLPSRVEVVLGETAGMALLRYFCDCDAVVFLDAIDAGTTPGSIFRFGPDEAGMTETRSNNIHGMGLPHLLASARLLGHDPEIVCLAVQVGDVRPRPGAFSAEVEAALPQLAELARAEAVRLAGACA